MARCFAFRARSASVAVVVGDLVWSWCSPRACRLVVIRRVGTARASPTSAPTRIRRVPPSRRRLAAVRVRAQRAASSRATAAVRAVRPREAELGVDVLQVPLDGAHAEVQLGGDRVVVAARRRRARRTSSSRGESSVGESAAERRRRAAGPGQERRRPRRRNTGHAGSSSSTMWLLLSRATSRAPGMCAARYRASSKSFIWSPRLCRTSVGRSSSARQPASRRRACAAARGDGGLGRDRHAAAGRRASASAPRCAPGIIMRR